jgi:uncharacterized membrane protein YhaH (DUF805 family)
LTRYEFWLILIHYMNILENFSTIITKKYAQFNGRASRAEFWFFHLISDLIIIALVIISGLSQKGYLENILISIFGLYLLFMFIPILALRVRRMHDVGQSGWIILLSLIPIVGALVLFIFELTPSQNGGNKYGPNPYEKK